MSPFDYVFLGALGAYWASGVFLVAVLFRRWHTPVRWWVTAPVFAALWPVVVMDQVER